MPNRTGLPTEGRTDMGDVQWQFGVAVSDGRNRAVSAPLLSHLTHSRGRPDPEAVVLKASFFGLDGIDSAHQKRLADVAGEVALPAFIPDRSAHLDEITN